MLITEDKERILSFRILDYHKDLLTTKKVWVTRNFFSAVLQVLLAEGTSHIALHGIAMPIVTDASMYIAMQWAKGA